ncbi:MAG: hypothetical protein DSZ28_04760 [Thiothrix sp.]|nr:MAG: hypothetical protein DSZ28_04760 [Thiothrix sp.]
MSSSPAHQPTPMPAQLTLLATSFYLLTIYLLVRPVGVPTNKAPHLPLLTIALWAVSLTLHAATLNQSLLTESGLDLSFFNALSLVGWLVATLLFATTLRQPLESLAIVLLPLIIIILLTGLMAPVLNQQIIVEGMGLKMHILGSLLAFSILSLAAAQALILSYQDYHLRNHQLTGWVRHLPPLQYMESFLFQLIWLGFFLLSAALVSGWMFLDDIFAQHLLHKTVLSFLAWVLFAMLLMGRLLAGWRGRKAIHWTLGGFALLVLAYFGSKMVLEIILLKP